MTRSRDQALRASSDGQRTALIASKLGLATAAASAALACGAAAAPPGPSARRVIVAAPEGDATPVGRDGILLGENREPTVEPCRAVCAAVQAAGEELVACQRVEKSWTLEQRIPETKLMVCKLRQR